MIKTKKPNPGTEIRFDMQEVEPVLGNDQESARVPAAEDQREPLVGKFAIIVVNRHDPGVGLFRPLLKSLASNENSGTQFVVVGVPGTTKLH